MLCWVRVCVGIVLNHTLSNEACAFRDAIWVTEPCPIESPVWYNSKSVSIEC